VNSDDPAIFYDDPAVFYDATSPIPERKQKMAKIKLDHTNLAAPAFVVRMKEISTALTGNAVFASLAANVTAFDTKVGTLETKSAAYDATVQAGKTVLTERDDARVAVEDAARGLAGASEGVTSDAAQLQSGGWHLRGAPTPVGPMPAPQNLSATAGDLDGEVDLSWEPVSGRDTYVGEHSISATGPWTQFYIGKKSGTTATGLASATMYWFRIRAVGTAGSGPFSDIAQKRAT